MERTLAVVPLEQVDPVLVLDVAVVQTLAYFQVCARDARGVPPVALKWVPLVAGKLVPVISA